MGLFGAITGIVKRGFAATPIGQAIGIVGSLVPGKPTPAGCPPGFNKDVTGACIQARGRSFGPALPGFVDDPRDMVSSSPGFGRPFGEAVVGRFGAGLQPRDQPINRRECPRGAVLAIDGLCYNRGVLKNDQRAWPRGRAPLLTGGERNAITIASRAAGKIKTAEKQLRKLGMLKAPTSRRSAAQPKLLAHGKHGTSIINVD